MTSSNRKLKRPGNIATWAIKGQIQGTTSNNRQIYNILQAPVKEFTHVRGVMRNWTNGTSRGSIPDFGGGEGIILAVTQDGTRYIHPVLNGDTSAKSLTNDPTTGWCNLLWNGQKQPICPLADSSFGAFRSSYSFSDWLYMPSVPPTSAGAIYPFLMMSTWSPGTVPTWSSIAVSSSTGMESLLNRGCWVRGYDDFKSTNGFVTNPETATYTPSSGSLASFFPIQEFQFISKQPVVNIMGIGDSMFTGQGDPVGTFINSFYTRACHILRSESNYSVNAMHYGWGATTSAQYVDFGRDAVSIYKPDIVLYGLYTTNDSAPTEAIIDQQFARGMEFANYCTEIGSLCVFVFLTANNLGYTATQDDRRKRLINLAKNSGIPVFDLVPFTSNNNTPAGILPGFAADTVHLSAAGYEAAARGLAPMLAALIDENFNNVRILPQ